MVKLITDHRFSFLPAVRENAQCSTRLPTLDVRRATFAVLLSRITVIYAQVATVRGGGKQFT